MSIIIGEIKILKSIKTGWKIIIPSKYKPHESLKKLRKRNIYNVTPKTNE